MWSPVEVVVGFGLRREFLFEGGGRNDGGVEGGILEGWRRGKDAWCGLILSVANRFHESPPVVCIS